MSLYAFPIIGRQPTVNLFRAIDRAEPANENDRIRERWEHVVERARFLRAWVRKLEKRALRLVRP